MYDCTPYFTRKKLSLFDQLFSCNHLFEDLTSSMLDDGDPSLCSFLDSWIDEKFQDEFDEFSWEDCQNMSYSSMDYQEFIDYAAELNIPIDQEALAEMQDACGIVSF